VVLLGLGFTTSRLAWRLLRNNSGARPPRILAAVRQPERFRLLEDAGVELRPIDPDGFPDGAVLVHTVPPVPQPDAGNLRRFMEAIRPVRLLYISSTGVYGAQREVDGSTQPAPSEEKGLRRADEEKWVACGPWSHLILRAAAIYGPGRGVHVRLLEGKLPRGAGSEVVSRIHADDLAALLEAGLYSGVQGAFPAADEHPCSSDEIVAWCSRHLGLGTPCGDRTFPVSGRRVDGRRIFELLGIRPSYPDYKKGIPASLAEEGWPGLNSVPTA